MLKVLSVAMFTTLLCGLSGCEKREAALDPIDPQSKKSIEKGEDIVNARKSRLVDDAIAGKAESQYELGRLYQIGEGFAKNDDSSFAWYLKAASQGHQQAQLQIAILYSLGRGTKQDYLRSYVWNILASSQCISSSSTDCQTEFHQWRDGVESYLSSSQRTDGQRLAAAWRKGETFQENRQQVGDNAARIQANNKTSSLPAVDADLQAATGYLPNTAISAKGGHSNFTVDNKSGASDAVVRLYKNGRKPAVRSFYVKVGEQFAADKLLPGDYVMRYRYIGNEDTYEADRVFLLTENEDNGRANFSNIRVTLYKVSDGNMTTKRVPSSDF